MLHLACFDLVITDIELVLPFDWALHVGIVAESRGNTE